MRLVFMGTPDFAVPSLEALIASGHEVALVVTRPDKPRGRGQKASPCAVKQVAQRLGLPVEHPSKLDVEFINRLQQLKVECGIIVAYGRILPKTLLEAIPRGWINVHASLLPAYRGPAPIHRAVIAGERLTGITTMCVAPGLDEGNILLQASLPIGPNESTGAVYDRLATIGGQLLTETVEQVAQGVLTSRPQDPVLATYAPLLTRDDELIHWGQAAIEVHNRVRGMNPWPGTYTIDHGKILKICSGRVDSERVIAMVQGQAGEVVDIQGEEVAVITGEGCYWLREVQPGGGKRMSAAAYLRGQRSGSGYCFS